PGSIGLLGGPEEHFEYPGKILFRNSYPVVGEGNICPQVININLHHNLRDTADLYLAILDGVGDKVSEDLGNPPWIAVKVHTLHRHLPDEVLCTLQVIKIPESAFNDLRKFHLPYA